MILLAKLLAHYHRPDLSPEQAKSLAFDLADDLGGYAVCEVELAIRAYRQNPKEKFFPRSGQLREIMDIRRKEATEAQRVRPLKLDSRPLRWWTISRKSWKPHWRDDDIPPNEIEPYRKWRAAGHGQ